jgi:hypothetical protein
MPSDTSKKYREIYDKFIVCASEGVIFRYDILTDDFVFQPMSHNIHENGVQQLGELMRKNLFFYCYGEEEVVERCKDFKNIHQASVYSYRNRAPIRPEKMDGLPGEVLLDLLIQLFEKDTYKLAVRPLLSQNRKEELKGYDLAYFTLKNEKITIWLGQAKSGGREYCKYGIHEDLLKKFNKEYLTEQMLFVCDRSVKTTDKCRKIVRIINELNTATLEVDAAERENLLLDRFKKNDISINIPCLLAYDESRVYSDPLKLKEEVSNEVENMRKYFSNKRYEFEGFNPNIIFFVFPIKNIDELRDNKRGFYSGLR